MENHCANLRKISNRTKPLYFKIHLSILSLQIFYRIEVYLNKKKKNNQNIFNSKIIFPTSLKRI